jgi:ATP-dependent Lhr-like helicase
MPLSTLLSAAVLDLVQSAAERGGKLPKPSTRGLLPEVQAVLPLLQTQARWSRLPGDDCLLIERVQSREGQHAFLFPFAGRLVHEGLAALVAWRIAQRQPSTLTMAATDWGFELAGREPFFGHEREWRQVLSPANLLEDLLACLNGTEMARRHFREIARVAGLVAGGRRTSRQTQSSAGLIFDVLSEHDSGNMLLAQTRREVLEQQFEFGRLREAVEAIAVKDIRIIDTPRLSPLAFPIWAEQVQSRLTTQGWLERITEMARELEQAAGATRS